MCGVRSMDRGRGRWWRCGDRWRGPGEGRGYPLPARRKGEKSRACVPRHSANPDARDFYPARRPSRQAGRTKKANWRFARPERRAERQPCNTKSSGYMDDAPWTSGIHRERRPKKPENKARAASSQLTQHAPQLRLHWRNEFPAKAYERVENARGGSIPDSGAIHSRREARDGGLRGGDERGRGVRPRCRQNSIMAREECAHANDMKEPGTERSESRGLKIVMDKGLCGRRVMPAKKGGQVITAKMVHDTGGNVDLPGKICRERVSVKKLAGKRFRLGEAIGFGNERRVEIHSGQLNVFSRQGCMCRQPANGVADPAPDVDNPDSSWGAIRPQSVNRGAQKPEHAMPVIKL